MRGMCTEKKTSTKLEANKIAFPPKPNIRTDICNYRVVSLLKISEITLAHRRKVPKINCQNFTGTSNQIRDFTKEIESLSLKNKPITHQIVPTPLENS